MEKSSRRILEDMLMKLVVNQGPGKENGKVYLARYHT